MSGDSLNVPGIRINNPATVSGIQSQGSKDSQKSQTLRQQILQTYGNPADIAHFSKPAVREQNAAALAQSNFGNINPFVKSTFKNPMSDVLYRTRSEKDKDSGTSRNATAARDKKQNPFLGGDSSGLEGLFGDAAAVSFNARQQFGSDSESQASLT